MSERVQLTYDEAIAMLRVRGKPKSGRRVHTFKSAGPCIVGADWSWRDVKAHIREYGAELAGPAATQMKHGIASGGVFFETVVPGE